MMLPNGWKKVKLGEICNKIGSGSTPKGGREVYLNAGIPIIRSQNVLNGFLDLNDVAFISDEQHSKMKGTWVHPNDILLNITGASIGRSCVVPATVKMANVNQHVCIIRLNECADACYVCNLILSKDVQKQIELLSVGGGRQGLNFQQIASFGFLLPPLEEQKKIAEILATQDRVIELKEKLIAEKQSQKKYLSQMLLTGKKRVGDYKDHWEYSALSNYLTIKDVRQIPNDEAPLMAFIAGMGVSPKGERYDRSFLVKNDKKEYKRTDLNDFIYSSNNLDVGSIGLNSYGSASISVVYEIFSVNSNAVPVVLSSIIQLPENLNYALRFRQGAIYGQYRIYAEDFLSMKIKIPSLPEQKAIADVLSAADEEISLLQKSLEQEKLKKKSLMQLLLTGLVRVQ